MKSSIKIAIALGIVVAVLVLVTALAFTPSFQKWALKRSLPGAEVEHLSAGMSSAEVRDLTLNQDGALISVPSAKAEYSAWSYLTGSGIEISSIDAKGIVVDLRNYAPPPVAPSAPMNFEDMLGALLIPAGLKLGSADIDAEIILPAPDVADGRRARVTIKGGGIGASTEAVFDYSATFTDPSAGAVVSAVKATGRLAFAAAADGTINNVTARAELQAEGEGIPPGEMIVIEAGSKRDPDTRESFSLTVARRGAGAEETELVSAAAKFDPAANAWEGTWTIAADNTRLASVLPAQTTPEFDLSGEGRFTVKAGSSESTASGEIKGSAASLERVVSGLEGVGRIVFSAAFSVASDSNGVRVDTVRANVATSEGQTLLSLSTLQAVTFDPESGQVGFADPEKDLATMEIADVPVAWMSPFVEGYKLSGGTISGAFLVQSTPSGDRVQLRASKPLLVGPVTVADDTQTLLEGASISVTPEVSYTAARIDATISSWSLTTAAGDKIEGTARALITQQPSPSTDFTVKFAGRLPAMLKPFSPVVVGIVAIDGTLEGNSTEENLAIRAGRFVVQDAAGATLLSAELRQPLDLNLMTMEPAVKDASTPAASIAFGNLPLGWVEPFVPNSAFGGVVESGAVDLTLAKDGPAVATTKPVVLRAVSVTLERKPLIEGLDLTWDGSAAMNGDAMSAEIRSLDVRQGSTQLLALKAVLESNGATDPKLIRATAKGTLDANLGAILAQPAAAEWRVLESGRLSTQFDVTATDSIKVVLKADAKNLVAVQDRKPLGDVSLSVDAKVNVGKDGEFRIPLTVLNSGRTSDAILAGSFTQSGEKLVLNARISGETIHLDDFSALAAFGPSEGAVATDATTPESPRNTTRDTEPFWAGAEGTFEIDIKNLVGGAEKPITDLKARAVMAADSVTIEKFTGNAGGSEVTASGSLRFIAADPTPYMLESKFKVPGLDMATFFTAEAPGKPAILETVVVAEGTTTGRGLNLDDLLARLQGRIDVAGGKGVYRGLARQSDRISTGAGLVGALGGLLGGGQKVQDATQAVAEFAGELRELHFDRLTLKAARGNDLKLNIETIDMAGPKFRLSGKGVVNMDPEVPLARQSQRLEMRIGLKQSIGEKMVQLRMSDGTKDELGYAQFRVPIILTGNVMSPDSKQFWEAVGRSVVEMGVQGFMGGQ
jgi:hypothetical protein